jgi:8-oxo-dGTP pyrophosphatase MutT (NUDIX family)
MLRWQTLLGVLIGLLAGGAILGFGSGGVRKPPPSGPVLSESDGHLSELVIQYEPRSRQIVAAAYRDFLGALEADVTVQVVCPSRAAFVELSAAVGPVKCRLCPILVNHPMTTWSRDRWLALAPATATAPITLLTPHREEGDSIWPQRAGDERVGMDIAAALAPDVSTRRSDLYFDGGDFLVDTHNVFVMPRILAHNVQHTVYHREELLGVLAADLKRHVILLDEAPDHHAGMYVASVGGKTMVVGDPSLGSKFVPVGSTNGFMNLPGGPDFSTTTQHLFDAVARQCAAVGYRVVRVPTIPAHDGKTYLTYVNVILDQQGERRIVYLPYYRGAEALNAAARAVWEELGYEIRPVDCTDTFRQFGCLHCLVNVLKRAPGREARGV